MENKLIDQLSFLGCNRHEASVFHALIEERDGISVQLLGKKVGIPRPTLYGYIHTLESLGLVHKTHDDERARYWAVSKERVKGLFFEKQHALQLAERVVLEEMEKCAVDGSQGMHRPKLIFFNGSNAAEEVLRDILRSAEKDAHWFWPIREMLEVVPTSFMQYFHEERIRRRIFLHVLWPQESSVNIKKHPELGLLDSDISLREIRILPRDAHAFIGYGVYGNRVGFVASSRESYGFVLESNDLSKTMKASFQYWWAKSSVLKVKK